MTEANKINHDDLLKHYEITLAKCGWLVLVWLAYPGNNCGKYELRSNGEKIFETNYLFEAVTKYNELVA